MAEKGRSRIADKLDKRVRALAEQVIAEGKNKRAIATLRVLLAKGSISTDDLQEMGYNHPPRAIGDVRDAGIPIVTKGAISPRTGRRMAVYTFGDPSQIQAGRIGGRSAFPKDLKTGLLKERGSVDWITGATVDERVLQIDHRIPYRIAGDVNFDHLDIRDFMLLDGSSQRAKSFSCENCPNMQGPRDPSVCRTCFWAYPESYKHIATVDIRRVDVSWQGSDVAVYDTFKKEADKLGIDVAELIRRIVRQRSKGS